MIRSTGLGDAAVLMRATPARAAILRQVDQQGGGPLNLNSRVQALANTSFAQPGSLVPQTYFRPDLAPGIAPAMSMTRLALYAGAALGGAYLLWKLVRGKSSSLPVRENPRRRNPERVPVVTTSARLRKAVDKYESFHWGEEPRRIVAKKVSKPPKVGVKLGKLVAVAYETTKNGEHAVWEHNFGEEGGKRPDLIEDADTGRLHIVGGSYKVRPEGIID